MCKCYLGKVDSGIPGCRRNGRENNKSVAPVFGIFIIETKYIPTPSFNSV